MNSAASYQLVPLSHIVICGGGLAGYMTAAALLKALPSATEITHIVGPQQPAADIFYGGVTAPSAYGFNLALGVSEPSLVMDSSSAFSLGTKYQEWGGERRSWFQGFQLPLPILNGVPFHQYLIRQQIPDLEPFLVSAAAARRGAFAHPPEKAGHPFARAEYGYQFDAGPYCRLFANVIEGSRIRTIIADVADVETHSDAISAVHLSNGQSVSADLFIDCTGPEAALLSKLDGKYIGDRQLTAILSQHPSDKLGPAARTVSGHAYGWHSVTPSQGSFAKLSLFVDGGEEAALAWHEKMPDIRSTACFGRQTHAWTGNCVAVGQAAAMVEPLTPAPVMLLQKDIERLISLVPMSGEMSMERREFNRQFVDDYDHAELFRRAFFATTPMAQSPYWLAADALPAGPKLDRKLQQFLSRGVLVSYDLEPFTPEDWVILHYGMGRRPDRHDRLADQATTAELKRYFETLRRDVEASAFTLPSHDTYMTKLTRYLAREGA